ncbi:MAG: UDP-N-acetylmuramoyl-L-alanine--D-glutamate ligase [Bryobacterales bacterium]|nr:UDP-N-acetylmuramoyl-L-alanine--D-glutamate ligase [Bryobacterales bacterium]
MSGTQLQFGGARVVVAGMGKSGLAALELLAEKGARLRATDVKPLAELPGLAELGVPFALQSPEVFQDADIIVISPGVACDLGPLEEARRRGVAVIGELELASYFLQGPVIGITGANGKTTTTALAGHILRQCGIPVQVGGNIGTPPASMVRASRADQWNVLELSSFQLETIQYFRARVGACLNVTPDHLDRHHTFEIYAAAKRRLFETQQAGDFAILNADDATSASFAPCTPAQARWFSSSRRLERGAWLEDGRILLDGERLMDAAQVPLRGLHNLENVMAAALASAIAGAPPQGIAAAVQCFPGVEHRLELVRSVSGVEFYNDSKATNVDATLKALAAFERGLWVILGGKDKGSDYTPLIQPLRAKARAVLLIGAAAEKIAGHLGASVPLIRAGVIDAAVCQAYARAEPGDTVLLAPACASFDQFSSYEHRGRVFKDLVRALEPKE